MRSTLLAGALLPILLEARGANDGTNQENAVTTTLVDTEQATLTLHHYNDENDGVYELHGDLEIRWGSATSKQTAYPHFGFCAKQFAESTKWDCLWVKSQVDPDFIDELPANQRNFDVYDGFTIVNEGDLDSKDFSLLTLDSDWQVTNDAAKNWRFVASKSSKTGCEKDADNARIVKCTSLNAHWFRNFTTNSAEQDLQLAESLKGQTTQVVGFYGYATDYELQSKAQNVEQGALKDVSLVSEAFFNASPGGGAGDNDNNDGATMVTTFAAMMLAAVSALAF